VLMLWAYLLACIFLICAELCSQLNLWIINQNQAETPRIRIFADTSMARLPAEIPPPT
jgi:hypothetical protein